MTQDNSPSTYDRIRLGGRVAIACLAIQLFMAPQSSSARSAEVFVSAAVQIQAHDDDTEWPETAIPTTVRSGRALDFEGAPVRLRRNPLKANGGNSAAPNAMFMPFRSPVGAASVTSNFGMRTHPTLGGHRFHSGIDLAAPHGSPVAATADGTVSTAGWMGGYGLAVGLTHGNGLQTRYGHLSRISVYPGQFVSAGQIIGYVGSTGRSTGPHLHYETRFNGLAVKPNIAAGSARK